MEKVLIGVHGKPRAGKDTIAYYLMGKHNFVRFGPGDPVKRTAAVMFDVDIKNFYDDKLKDAMNPYWKMTHRDILQKVGKESSRDVFGEDFWMCHIEKKLLTLPDDVPGLVLPDIRYANETHWVRDHGGLMIFVERPNRPAVADESHPAEQGLPLELADIIIPNDGTIEDLHAKIDLIVEPLIWK